MDKNRIQKEYIKKKKEKGEFHERREKIVNKN